MAETILRYLDQAGVLISLAAVLVIVTGFSAGAAQYVRYFRELSRDQSFYRFKVEVGHALTLGLEVGRYRRSIARVVLGGLEVLVAATVIKTLTLDPTMESLGILAVMIAIRTILGWTMFVEISGRWPWQKAQ